MKYKLKKSHEIAKNNLLNKREIRKDYSDVNLNPIY